MPRPHAAYDLPAALQREIYIHRAVQKGLARVFFREYERRHQAAAAGRVAFRFLDVVYFFAVAAANGVVGNLAYHALAAAVRAVRKPKQEIATGGVTFEAVVLRRTYNRLRCQEHPGTRPSRASAIIESKLETKYKLMVALKRTARRN